ncbi:MAG: molybdopterin oxidoreductase family protein [Betaproteobacteria bacterium]|jgi:anaerobic selenocysteine-containing dehydrogenase|nr:molybdopterin oxidoreductase family protein [Betaproteobacteria bacterium]MBP6318798.1 molybdopterin oxidoreductase family protein [Rubrivivax sp.]MBK7460537.1 molybdopterin oxidoreductase family protein [Betaproteobacteria bacterium]MBK7516460.1 molybdopterin oxidoreductase family protein [Betaproteobacteria bacterium]MBK8107695.1 molybdopterin oxidoreductase family protein [Betaproteobacteria bacterium]
MAHAPLHDPTADPHADAAHETRNTTCYMCACRCGIRVHLRDGKVRYIDGNPDHPLNQGVICAKGSSGIMKQYSPARLTKPLKRRQGAERGAGDFEEIEWEEAFATLTERLGRIRATDPKKFALFTGRDQMQALTGLFARQFGTPNYAAHGGFCSVNMAAGMIYTIGGSFWEFGGPDLDRAKLFVMIGTAEDHHSNPLKIAISKFKRDGGRFVSVNPVRTGYSAIADEWVPIRPGTDGAFLLAVIHEILAKGLYDRDFVVQYTNGGELVDLDTASDEFGMFVRTEVPQEEACYDPQNKLWWDRHQDKAVVSHTKGADPFLLGEFRLPDGTPVKPSFQLLQDRVKDYTPEWAAQITGIPADTIRRLAHEMGITARDQRIELPIAWTDAWGNEHDTVSGNPVAFHAMRGLAAHSNGFQTIRALAILMSLLGTIDRPGGFRHKAPFPRPIPPCARTPNDARAVQPNRPLDGMALGWPSDPDDLFVNDDGSPVRIDKAFSWEYPLSVHGLMHNVVTNAWRGDPYPIDTLLIFMANMSWNSTMNTAEVRKMLNDKREDGEYKIPFLVVADAFQSEMTAYADLILPDTTYLERHDVMSMLDRPISEFDGPVDSVRIPVVPPSGDCKPFQEVLIELGTRLKLPTFVTPAGQRKYRDYPDFIVNWETEPGSGIGFLAGWRGKGGEKFLVGEPNPRQWEMYEQHNCVYHHELPRSYQYMRNWNQGYLEWSRANRITRYAEPILIHLYSEVLQRFRTAAQGKGLARKPPEHLKKRIETYFDPLPFFYEPLESHVTDKHKYPLAAVTQRPMAMYHSWDSQNAWLRQIHTYNLLHINTQTARAMAIADGDWVWVESQWGRVRCRAAHSQAVEPGTVWTWNAIGKAAGAWNLAGDANESRDGFLLNHLISEELPVRGSDARVSNSDPITGQAAWYDVRVRVVKAGADEPQHSEPQFQPLRRYPGMREPPQELAGLATAAPPAKALR